MTTLRRHELSTKFPSIPEDELELLAADIKKNGLKYTIILYKGEVLDGWHRYLACKKAGVNPRTTDYKGSDPVSFVRSANKFRRHCTPSQLAMVEVGLSEWLTPGKPSLTPSVEGIRSTAEMAASTGLGESTIERAKTVTRNGSEALKDAVLNDEISVRRAAEVTDLPKREQVAAAKEPKIKVTPLDKLQAAFNELKEKYDELKDHDQDVTDILQSREDATASDVEVKIKNLLEQVRNLKDRRDQLMTTNTALEKKLEWWKRQAIKLGWKPS